MIFYKHTYQVHTLKQNLILDVYNPASCLQITNIFLNLKKC
jgi:hypothetical protein